MACVQEYPRASGPRVQTCRVSDTAYHGFAPTGLIRVNRMQLAVAGDDRVGLGTSRIPRQERHDQRVVAWTIAVMPARTAGSYRRSVF